MNVSISNALTEVFTTTTTFIQNFITEYWPWLLGLFVLLGVISIVLKVPRKMIGK